MKEVKVFVPEEVEMQLGVEDCKLYWLYWTPYGDEAMLGYIKDGVIYEETTAWWAYLKLLDLNQHLRKFELGNSDEEAKEVLLIDKKRRKAFIATFRELEVILW
jgi:hypothetical protein